MIEQNDIKALQAEGKGPAPCARFCEATAFRIEIAGWKRDQAENLANQCGLVDQITALTAERDEWKARCEFSFKQRDKLTAERDALKDAARLALDALSEYGNPYNWDEDFHGIRRKWKEPESNTPSTYNGFELAQPAISALKAVL